MRKLLLVCFFLGYSLCGSTQGIEFKETNFDKILEIAKKEGKMIFLDVYTVWCGPCKMMAKDIFPLQEVGEFYNTHFISMKVDAEKKENIFIKKYNVNSFPTYLFLDENGELIYRALGHMEAKDFINVGQRALTEMKCKDNYSYLLEQYSIEWRKPHFLRNFLQVSLDRGFYLADLMKRYWTSQKIGVINSCGVGEILKEGKTISMDVDSFMADVNARNRKAEENVPEFFKKYPAEPITSKTDFCVGISNMVAEGLLKEMSEQIIFQVKEYNRVLDARYGAPDIRIHGGILKSEIAVGIQRAVFKHQILCIAKRLSALDSAVDELQALGVPAKEFAVDFRVVHRDVLRIPKGVFGVNLGVADHHIAAVLESIVAVMNIVGDINVGRMHE